MSEVKRTELEILDMAILLSSDREQLRCEINKVEYAPAGKRKALREVELDERIKAKSEAIELLRWLYKNEV